MMKHSQQRFYVDEDICKASTLPASFYRDSEYYHQSLERLFAGSWQWIGCQHDFPEGKNLFPGTL